ncbi:serpin-z1b [Phtheirospermum japonicum]|uniref:Serpin-z1b n=1 Tax=Phtheirospermum japonicum TaxID=374723 RepID=A0A830BZV3_9LAMI|nr:serpin-z1b [Phtheirospermum japonicum]
MVSDEGLDISGLFHKSSIEVDEQGTEATAASVVDIINCFSAPQEEEHKLDFVADHPFLFVVREDVSGTVLFVGQVLNPLHGY